jgi:FkbM family methyltransferase
MAESDTNGFAKVVERLEKTFSMDGVQMISRSQRELVTDLLVSALDDIIEIMSPDMFVEVGAFDAAFSRQMKKRYPLMPCLALEANPRVFEQFGAQVQATGVDYMHLAAAVESGTITFFIPEVIGGHVRPHVSRMGSLNEIGAQNSTMTEVTVPAVAIDDLLAPRPGNRLCMWMDVEGAMDKVLDGAARTLERTAIIYCEIEDRAMWKEQMLASEVLARLSKAGFTVAARDFQTPMQFNALLIRSEIADVDRVLARLSAFADDANETVLSLVGQPG